MNALIGALRLRVGLERPVVSVGGAVVWEAAGGAWARVTPAVAGEPALCRLELRARRDVRPGWRVALGDRRLRISNVRAADDRGARLIIDCREELQ